MKQTNNDSEILNRLEGPLLEVIDLVLAHSKHLTFEAQRTLCFHIKNILKERHKD